MEAIAAYLMSPHSDGMQHLALTRCSLSARDVALLMTSMGRTPGRARDLHLHVGQNALAHDASDFVDCIANGRTPSYLTMRMVDYPREEPFQELVRALTVNKTIVYLDMSKISLPYEAGEKTSLLLEGLFAKNTTLRELDISGEQAVLESASLGAGLLKPLGRIAENKSLEVLRIECTHSYLLADVADPHSAIAGHARCDGAGFDDTKQHNIARDPLRNERHSPERIHGASQCGRAQPRAALSSADGPRPVRAATGAQRTAMSTGGLGTGAATSGIIGKEVEFPAQGRQGSVGDGADWQEGVVFGG